MTKFSTLYYNYTYRWGSSNSVFKKSLISQHITHFLFINEHIIKEMASPDCGALKRQKENFEDIGCNNYNKQLPSVGLGEGKRLGWSELRGLERKSAELSPEGTELNWCQALKEVRSGTYGTRSRLWGRSAVHAANISETHSERGPGNGTSWD